jgi:predicted transposase/invertase (TIGR01784 family)
MIISSVLYILEFIDEEYKPFLFEKLDKKLEEVNLMSIAQSLRNEGFTIGEKKGMEKGMEKGKIETAKKLLLKEIDINIIAEATDLSIEQIKSLK